jgi:hypothetical protein
MTSLTETLPRRSRLAALLDHFAQVEDPRDVRRIVHPLPEVLFLMVCGTIADCDDYEDIAAWADSPLTARLNWIPSPGSASRRHAEESGLADPRRQS